MIFPVTKARHICRVAQASHRTHDTVARFERLGPAGSVTLSTRSGKLKPLIAGVYPYLPGNWFTHSCSDIN